MSALDFSLTVIYTGSVTVLESYNTKSIVTKQAISQLKVVNGRDGALRFSTANGAMHVYVDEALYKGQALFVSLKEIHIQLQL